MRLIFLPLAACATIASASETAKTVQTPGPGLPAAAAPLAMPSYSTPPAQWRVLRDVLPPTPEQCRDRIHEIRQQRGLPELEGDGAQEKQPLKLWAVDRREDGCSVLVVAGNPDDVRALPKVKEDLRIRPIPAAD